MGRSWYLDQQGLQGLLEALVRHGYEVIGPVVADGVIRLEPIPPDDPDDGGSSIARGVREVTSPGSYRLEPAGDEGLAWGHGPDSAKRYLFPSREELSTARRPKGDLTVSAAPLPDAPYALIGLRGCDLGAVQVQDRVFMVADPGYRSRRESAFLVGVDCIDPGENCFCASMGTGPACAGGFDIALTAVGRDLSVARAGSARGERLIQGIGAPDATGEQVARANSLVADAKQRMGRELAVDDLPDLLYRNREHPRWGDVASRCLACTNCTMVCPTCFCHDIVDGISLNGMDATRVRQWASCFSSEFSHMSSGDLRTSVSARYRQWLTHKFASWIDQFGVSGCVGCGRCITWCPAGIDVTAEIEAIRASDGALEVGT
jgi:ferredoxin